LVLIFFLLGILIDRAFLYYENSEKNKILLIEQEAIKNDYKLLIEQFELVEKELQRRELEDSIFIYDSTLNFEEN